MTTESFLAPGQYLVYIPNQQRFADVEGYTHIARKIRDYIQDDILWYDFILETDTDGDILSNTVPITVPGDRVVSDLPFHNIEPRVMYHFAPLTSVATDSVPYPIQARSFVIKSNVTRPLESTSRSALGSGIYGRYVNNPSNVDALRNAPDQEVYEIDCSSAYPLQDKEHGESLTVASLNTNRYLDRILESLREAEEINFATVLGQIKLNESPTLFTLWNIVLYRTFDSLSRDELNEILAQYVVDYLTGSSLRDTVNGEPLQELPINRILQRLGYDGVIASDPYNNGWNRGCVSYNYSQAQVIQGEFARY